MSSKDVGRVDRPSFPLYSLNIFKTFPLCYFPLSSAPLQVCPRSRSRTTPWRRRSLTLATLLVPKTWQSHQMRTRRWYPARTEDSSSRKVASRTIQMSPSKNTTTMPRGQEKKNRLSSAQKPIGERSCSERRLQMLSKAILLADLT